MISRKVFFIFGLLILLLIVSCSFWSWRPSDDSDQYHIMPLPDFASFKVVSDKKRAFFDYFSPLVAAVNQEIKTERSRLKGLRDLESLSSDDGKWLISLADKYEVTWSSDSPKERDIRQLLMRVDELPDSLVLSQAAIESAWGTSRFAREGSNFFGQWCYSKGCGLVPSARAATASHEVKVFESPLESVRAYFDNLNRNRAYAPLRQLRFKARGAGLALSGCYLAEGLVRYSELGAKYVSQIKALIRINGLEKSKHCQKSPKTKD